MSVALAVQAAVLLASAAAANRVWRSRAPSQRHALWYAAVVTALVLPVTSLLSPSWAVLDRPRPTRTFDGPLIAAPNSGRVPTSVLAASAWIAGSGLVGFYFLAGHVRLWQIRRRALPAPAAWTTAAARLGARARLTVQIDVLVTDEVPAPLVSGVARAAVLIPPEAGSWSADRREAALIHELAHVARGDLVAQLAAQTLATVHWFNPLAWQALREMRRERELACDEAVVAAGVEPVSYATALLEIACAASGRRGPKAALPMARVSELEGRLSALLASSHQRGQPSRPARVAIGVAMASLSVAVGGARLTAPDPGATRGSSNRALAWTLIPGPAEAIARAGEAQVNAPADGRTRERETLLLGLTPGTEVVSPLLRALGDPDAAVREKAALGLAWRRDARIGPALVIAAADPSPAVREKALVALAFSDEPRAGALLAAARSDPDPAVRDKARDLGGRQDRQDR